MYAGTYNLPPIELCETSKKVKLMRSPSSLGNSPAKQVDRSANIQRMCAGTYNLTVEAQAPQAEPLELVEDCHISCNGPTQLVAAQIELFEFCERRK